MFVYLVQYAQQFQLKKLTQPNLDHLLHRREAGLKVPPAGRVMEDLTRVPAATHALLHTSKCHK